MKADLFTNTGFDSVNIPSCPDLLYTEEFEDCLYKSYDDIWILQDQVGPFIDIREENAEKVLSCDFIIIYDEDIPSGEDWINKATCFIVKSAQLLASDTCRIYLLKDAYNTMGGFDHRFNHNNIVISASANRLSVPLIKYTDKDGHTEDDAGYSHYKAIWPQRENEDFFTLEEPFQPSQKCIMTYSGFDPDPRPVEPIDISKFKYSKTVVGYTPDGGGMSYNGGGAGFYYAKTVENWYTETGGSSATTFLFEIDLHAYSVGATVTDRINIYNDTVAYFKNRIDAYVTQFKLEWTEENRTFANDLANVIKPLIQPLLLKQYEHGERLTSNSYNKISIKPYYAIKKNDTIKKVTVYMNKTTYDTVYYEASAAAFPNDSFEEGQLYYHISLNTFLTSGEYECYIDRSGNIKYERFTS